MAFFRKDIIGLKNLTADEILYILDTAETMKYVLSQKNKKAPHLQGKSVIMLFYEKSSRTKLSYELAAQYLSASFVNMEVSLDVRHGGNVIDMGHIIDQMGADFIIIRHPMSGTAKLLGENVAASVINAGDGVNENPSQSLLDLLTIKNQKGSFKDLKVAIIGDVAHSRVTKSNIWGLIKLGAHVSIAAPPTLVPPQLDKFGVNVYYNIKEAVSEADVIMVLRTQPEGQLNNLIPSLNEYKNLFKVDEKTLQYAKKDAIIMHPGPINRGIEISSQVIESKQCLVDDQIANGVAVRMALLYLLSMKGGLPK